MSGQSMEYKMYTEEELQKELTWAYSNQEVIFRLYESGKKTESQIEVLRKQKEIYSANLSELIQTANHMTAIYKNVRNYIEKHAAAAEEVFNMAIASAAVCVPDASCQGIKLEFDDVRSSAIITTPEGFDVSAIEGSGYGSVLSIMLRYACLKAQPGAIPLLILDEQASTLSGANVPLLYDLLKVMARDISIICIEQRGLEQTGIVERSYTFSKQDDRTTTVTEEVINEVS